MDDLTPQDLGWLAGLLEGEGWFLISWKNSTTGLKYPEFRAGVRMTDRDVVERAQLVTGLGLFRGPHKQRQQGWKPSWTWMVGRRSEVAELCGVVRPLMGLRRGEKIDEIMRLYAEFPPRVKSRCGTRHQYEKGCRCTACRAAHAAHHRGRRCRRRDAEVEAIIHERYLAEASTTSP